LTLWLLLACQPTVIAVDDTAAPGLAFDAPPENVLFITLDTTRRDAIGRWSGEDTTPNIDALLADAVVLEDHRSCSNWTWDSVLCLQTGSTPYSLDFDYVSNLGAPNESVSETTRLASDALSDAGFQTALISAQPFMSAQTNLDRGFQHLFFQNDVNAEVITSSALATLAAFDPAMPWYMHLHYMDPHDLYRAPPAYVGELAPIDYDPADRASWEVLLLEYPQLDADTQAHIREHLQTLYLGELRYADEQIGRLLKSMSGEGWLDDTLVVFVTDHGEQIWQHEHATHGASLFEEENRSAAAMWSRGLAPGTWDGPSTHVDIWPTAMAALGIPWDSQGLPLGARGPESALTALRYRGENTLQAAIRQDVKLVYQWSGEKALYRLADDPGELVNRYDPEDSEVLALWDVLMPEVNGLRQGLDTTDPVDPGP